MKKVHADKRQIFENGTKKYDKANKELSDAEQALEVENRSYERQIDDRKNRKIAIGNEIKHEREQQNSSNRSRLESERQRNENNILKSKKILYALHFMRMTTKLSPVSHINFFKIKKFLFLER